MGMILIRILLNTEHYQEDIKMKDYWLIYSNNDLSSYAIKIICDNYYIVNNTILRYLTDQKIYFTILDRINIKEVRTFLYRLDIGKKYKDTFTIFHFPEIKLISETKNTYKFRYKKYEIVVPKKLCRDLEQL